MIDYLHKLAVLSVPAFVISSVLTMGMSQRPADVIAPIEKPWPVVLALLVNFVLAPLLSVALCRLGCRCNRPTPWPAAPRRCCRRALLPELAEISGGSLAYSVALMVLLMVGSIVFMPLALPFIVPGLKADPLSIAKPC